MKFEILMKRLLQILINSKSEMIHITAPPSVDQNTESGISCSGEDCLPFKAEEYLQHSICVHCTSTAIGFSNASGGVM